MHGSWCLDILFTPLHWSALWSLFKPVLNMIPKVRCSSLSPHKSLFSLFLTPTDIPPGDTTVLLLKDSFCPWYIISAELRNPETLRRTLGPINMYNIFPLHLQVLFLWFMNTSKAREYIFRKPFFLFIEPVLIGGSVFPKL